MVPQPGTLTPPDRGRTAETYKGGLPRAVSLIHVLCYFSRVTDISPKIRAISS